MNAGRIVIVGLRPMHGQEGALLELVRNHIKILREEKLVTDRASIIMQAEDGAVIEVFEWKSKESMEAAHGNVAVMQLWEEFSKICEYVPVSTIQECKEIFSEFTPVN